MNVSTLMSELLVGASLCVSAGDVPRVWMSFHGRENLARDAEDLKAHGVEVVELGNSTNNLQEVLKTLRETGLKGSVEVPDVTEAGIRVKAQGLKPVPARMLGGVYNGIATDRSLFSFTAARHSILIEPPVYSPDCRYRRNRFPKDAPESQRVVGHYYPGLSAPVKTEVVVPLKPFDGQQHLKIIEAQIQSACENAVPRGDSTARIPFPDRPEVVNRKLWRLDFDLTGLDKACLHQIGLAIYWELGDQNEYWMFQHGQVAPAAESTRAAMRREVERVLGAWTAANGGTFPSDAIVALRVGDECFNLTGHLGALYASYPLWDFSAPGIQAFEAYAGQGLAYPRTWGYPEVYGEEAYGCWLYCYHRACAELLGIARETAHRLAPGILVYRNTTRGGVWALLNDLDGSAQELDARNLDFIHLDPYPVSANSYAACIPDDMAYAAGLARRLNKPLIPWLQAHVYPGASGKGLIHPTPAQVDRMMDEHLRHGIDGVIWLGYGKGRPAVNTFPDGDPASWQRAGDRHAAFRAAPPTRPVAKVALLRHYNKRALHSRSMDNGHRGPGDWALQLFAETWVREKGQAYDVFEIPPHETPAETSVRAEELRKYAYLVSDYPYPGATDVTTFCPNPAKVLSADTEVIRAKVRALADSFLLARGE